VGSGGQAVDLPSRFPPAGVLVRPARRGRHHSEEPLHGGADHRRAEGRRTRQPVQALCRKHSDPEHLVVAIADWFVMAYLCIDRVPASAL